MGRQNPVGTPFLVKRPDSSRYSYIRDIPLPLRAHLSGEVLCAWDQKRKCVGGGATVKVSLGTGDLATAKTRWSDLHAQVEKLIQSANRRANHEAILQNPIRQVSGLTPAQIQALGEQYFHDVLATDDALSLDRTRREEAVLLDLHLSGVTGVPKVSDIRREETIQHDREALFARKMLSEEAYAEFDRTAHFSTAGVWMDGEEAPGGGEHLFDEPSEVEQRLTINGITLPVGHPDRIALSREILRQKARAHDAVVARRDIARDPVQTPPRPVVSLQQEAVLDGQSLREAFKRWVERQKPRDHTVGEYSLFVERYIAICGDHGINAISRATVSVFRDTLEDYPRKVPKDKGSLDPMALIEWARKHPEVPRLSRSTIDDKAIAAISAILAIAVKDGKLVSNPCSGTKFGPDEGEVEERPPYDLADLNMFFASPVYYHFPNLVVHLVRGDQRNIKPWMTPTLTALLKPGGRPLRRRRPEGSALLDKPPHRCRRLLWTSARGRSQH